MYCLKCGKQLPDGSKFCHSCGQNIDHAGGINDSVVSIKNDPEIVRAALEGAAAVVSAQKDKVSEIESLPLIGVLFIRSRTKNLF